MNLDRMSILQNTEEFVPQLREFASHLDHLDNIDVVMKSLKGIDRTRQDPSSYQISAIIDFITKITPKKVQGLIKREIHNTVCQSIYETLERRYISKDHISIPESTAFYLTPTFDISYKNERIISFSIGNNTIFPVLLHLDKWLSDNEQRLNSAILISNKESEIRKLTSERNNLLDRKKHFETIKTECFDVFEILNHFLMNYGYTH